MGTIEWAEEIGALRSGQAFVDLSGWRKVRVGGTEAEGWLNDLLSAELSGLAAGHARRSLLLSPTGRIRADVTVATTGLGILLFQDPTQSAPIDDLLSPYVLSSDVRLADVTDELLLVAVPGAGTVAVAPGAEVIRPSCLGSGIDLVAPPERAPSLRESLSDLVGAGPEALEVWRVERGMARLGVDLGEASLPQEAGLESVVAYEKGCFLGQEAMARVHNLGHPPFVLRAVGGVGPVGAGEAVLADDEAVGSVTSAAALENGRAAAIVRVRWAARVAELRTESGIALRPADPRWGAA